MSNTCDIYATELSSLVNRLSQDFEGKMKKKSDLFQQEMNDITDDMPDTEGADAAIGIDFDVEWKLQTIKLHLPEVTMKLQSWYFHLPSVTMKNKRIVFHTPSVRMVPKKIGQYPEIHGFTVKWKDIITHVPETFMEKQEIVMGIPEIYMEEQNIKLHVPEFKMGLQEIKLHLPEFRVRNISIESGNIQDEAEDAAEDFKSVVNADKLEFFSSAKSQIIPAVGKVFSCHRSNIQNSKDETLANFEPGLNQLRTAIEKLKSSGADQEVPNLQDQLQDLVSKRNEAANKFEESINGMLEEEKKTVQKIMAAFG